MNDAEKRDKVIRGLEAHANPKTCKTCAGEDCPYYNEGCSNTKVSCSFILAADALTLLKKEEARVMAEGDVLHSTGKPIWFESRGMYLSKKGFWILPFEVDPELHIRFVQSVTGGKITLSLIDYGKMWRCWTSRPSPKQMRETKWEDSDEKPV